MERPWKIGVVVLAEVVVAVVAEEALAGVAAVELVAEAAELVQERIFN